MATFDDFRSNHPDRSRIGDDSLVASGEETEQTKYQCVSLIKQYVRECFGLNPGAWGNAIQWWSATNPALLSRFTKDGSGLVQKGDIVVFRTIGKPAGDFSGLGHIGIATGNGDPNSIEILEQNGLGSGSGLGGDAIRTRYVARNRLAGVLRAITQTPAVPYTINLIDWKLLTVKPGRHKWNLSQGNFTEVNNNPLQTADADTHFTAKAVLRHRDPSLSQYVYYLEDASVPYGWNADDCIPYAPPAVPYVPPAPRYEAPPAEKYIVLTRLMRFDKGTDALVHSNTSGDIEPGQYFVIAKLHEAYNLSDDNMKDRGWWVNISDNKIPEPVVVPVQPVIEQPVDIVVPTVEPVNPPAPIIKRQYEMIKPVQMEAINAVPEVFSDLEGKTAVKAQLNPGSVKEYSMRTLVDGEEYYIPTLSMKKGWRHGIPRELLDYPQMHPAYSPLDVNQDGKVRWDDFVDFGSKYIDNVRTTVLKVTASPKINEAKQRITKAVDGFSKRSK